MPQVIETARLGRLDAFDDAGYPYQFSLQSSNLPVGDYRAEFRVTEDGPDERVVAWRATFDVVEGDADQGVEVIRRFIKAGTETLIERYGNGTK